MLVLTRKQQERIMVGGEIKIQVLEIKGKQVRLGIEAPLRLAIHREEVWLHIQKEITAAQGD